jgi:hypothetical protein
VTWFIDHSNIRLATTLYSSLLRARTRAHTHTHTHTQPVTVSNSRFLVTNPTDGDSLSSVLTSLLSGEYPATELFSTVNSTIAPSLLSALAELDSITNPQMNSLPQQPAVLLHSTELPISRPGVLYYLGAHPTENTASNSPSIVVMGGCLAIARISFPREHVYRAVTQKRLCLSAYCKNGCTHCPSRGLCSATGLYVTLFI